MPADPDALRASGSSRRREAPDRNLALELVRVTEAGAMAAGRWVGRGDKEGAFAWLERAFAQHNVRLRYVKFDPMLRKIRGDPRYTSLLREMNLPVE